MAIKNTEKFLTLHPDPTKKGVNIARVKYDQMREAILQLLSEHEQIGFSEGLKEIERRLAGKFDGKIGWYYVSVKLDLEARGQLIRLPGSGKQMMQKA